MLEGVQGADVMISLLTETIDRALRLAVARRIPQVHQYMAARRYKQWGPNLFLGGNVSPGESGTRKALGIVGFGESARQSRGERSDSTWMASPAIRTRAAIMGA